MTPSGSAITSEWLDLCVGFTGADLYGLGSKRTDWKPVAEMFIYLFIYLFLLGKKDKKVLMLFFTVKAYLGLSGWSVRS